MRATARFAGRSALVAKPSSASPSRPTQVAELEPTEQGADGRQGAVEGTVSAEFRSRRARSAPARYRASPGVGDALVVHGSRCRIHHPPARSLRQLNPHHPIIAAVHRLIVALGAVWRKAALLVRCGASVPSGCFPYASWAAEEASKPRIGKPAKLLA